MTQPDSAQTQRAQSTIGVRLLLAVVVAMGIMIVAGLAVIVGRIIYLSSATSKQAPVSGPAARAPATPTGQIELGLPAGAVVRNVALSGDRMAVHYEAATGAGVVLIDTVTGSVVSRVRIVTDEGARKDR